MSSPLGEVPHEQFELDTQSMPLPPDLTGEWKGNPALEMLFDAALRGELPRHRPLKPYEPEKLSPRHLEIVLAKAAGLKNGPIAEFFGFGEAQVSVICNHPDARYLIARLMAFKTEGIVDIQKRLEALAPVAIDTLTDIMLDGGEQVRTKIAFGILDRTGYGGESKQKVTHEFVVPQKQAGLLTDAIRERAQMREIEYAQFTVVENPGDSGNGTDGGQVSTSVVEETPSGSASPQQSSGNSKEEAA